jgi:hypothetical protein
LAQPLGVVAVGVAGHQIAVKRFVVGRIFVELEPVLQVVFPLVIGQCRPKLAPRRRLAECSTDLRHPLGAVALREQCALVSIATHSVHDVHF